MVYASENWAASVEEEQRMERNENVMLRWMCGVTLRDKVPTVELRRRLGNEGAVEVMRQDRLKWLVEWRFEAYGAKARDGNGPREVEVLHLGENV